MGRGIWFPCNSGPVHSDAERVAAALAPPSCPVYFGDRQQTISEEASRLKSAHPHLVQWICLGAIFLASPFAASQSKSRAPHPVRITPREISVPKWVAPAPGPDSGADTDGCGGSAADYSAWEMDLNNSGVPAVIIQGRTTCLCGGVGNCSFSIFQDVPPHKTLLYTDMVQEFHFKGTRTNGYRDLVTSTHGSAFDSELRVFRFDGTRYALKECYDQSYIWRDKQGNPHTMRNPKTTPEPCPQF